MKPFLSKYWIYFCSSLLLIGAVVFFIKRNHKTFEVQKLEDEAEVVKVKMEPFTELIPAYGVILRSSPDLEVEVAVDANDAKSLRVGLKAIVKANHFQKGTPGQVVRIIRGANAETGQSVVWIRAKNPDGKDHSGEFAWTRIEITSGEPVLVVPMEAILIKEGKPFVIKDDHKPIEVKLGRNNDESAEILEGLKEEDQVLSGGAVGYLYPDFKASSGD